MEPSGTQSSRAIFNHHMSYAELSRSLSFVCEQQRLLFPHELKCLELSFQDPFLKKVVALYPLSKKYRKLVTDSLEYQRAIQPPNAPAQVDIDVHSAIYSGVREKTAYYLQKNHLVQNHQDVVDKLEAFIDQLLPTPDAQEELRIGEAERYAKRQKEYSSGYLSVLTPLQSFEQIEADFRDYVTHLRGLYQENVTYAWDTLSSILQRLQTLVGPDRQESELLLLRALDDGRTAYHDKPSSFVTGKDYSCPKGLEERLLDHHACIVPTQRASSRPDILEHTIVALTEPFILRSPGGEKPSCSQALYQLYLNAAGYRQEEREETYFALSEGTDKNALKEQYLLSVEAGLAKRRAASDFQAFLGMAENAPTEVLERSYTGLVSFLNAQNGLLIRIKKTQAHLVAPEAPLESAVIVERMIEQGPFIDKAHLEMIFAISSEKSSLEIMEQAAVSGTPGTGAEFQQLRQDMRQIYREYLQAQEAPFYHFMEEELLERTLSAQNMQAIGCSQTVLCQWWEEHQPELWTAGAQQAAFFSAKCGYEAVIRILCKPGLVSPNYSDEQEEETLLGTAISNGHTDVVRALLESGASANLKTNNGSTPLIRAAATGNLEVVRLLIAAGADVNLQNAHRWSALMFSAISRDTHMLKILIDAGADLNLKRKYRQRTALIEAAESGHADIVRILVDHGAYATEQHIRGAGALMEASLLRRQQFLEDLESGNLDDSAASIAAGANVNRLSDGRSALDVAIQQQNPTLVRMLLDSEKLAPWVIVKALKDCVENRSYHQELLPLFLNLTSIVHLIIRNGYQRASLAWAVEHQCLAAVEVFIAAGASLDELNTAGETAVMVAQRLGYQGFEEFLTARGARIASAFATQTPDSLMFSGREAPGVISYENMAIRNALP